MKQILLPLAAAAAFITILGVLYKFPSATKNALQNPEQFIEKAVETKVFNKREIKVGEVSILVEVADTQEARNKGLSGRDSIAENEGMLFVFEALDKKHAFWMKDMKFAIDIIWINDGKIAQISKVVSPPDPGTPDRILPLYIPDAPADYVLEVAAGFSDKNGLITGNPVDLTSVLGK